MSDPDTAAHRPVPLRRGSAILALLIAGAGLAPPGHAHMRGLYATRAEAEQRASELNCKGTFAIGGRWMPCANERALHEALQKNP